MIKVKDDSIRISRLTGGMAFGHTIVADTFARHGYDCVITSGQDGEHMVGSKHGEGNALDYRIWHVPEPGRLQLVNELRQSLGTDFDVLLEGKAQGRAPHLHVELDPKPPAKILRA